MQRSGITQVYKKMLHFQISEETNRLQTGASGETSQGLPGLENHHYKDLYRGTTSKAKPITMNKDWISAAK